MGLRLKTILLLLFSSFMSVGWGQDCVDGVEVELWGECYNIEETTELDISDSGLIGEIPSEIGDLVNLNTLLLRNNLLTGVIPESIGNLTNLQSLNLRENQLIGEIPESIGNLTNLTLLILHNNELTGMIPESFGNLINVGIFMLNNNELSGEIPESIGNVGNSSFFPSINLSDNNLSGEIPKSICNIEFISIQNNNLCPTYPQCLTEEDIGYQDTSECEEPPLCDEEIEVELWGECYNIEETTTLILSGLTGEIPPEIGNLTNLTGLVLSSNQFIGGIPPEIGNLTNLTGLFLNNNQLTGRIPSEIGNLTNLTNLDLSDNELKEEIPSEIGNLTNLFQLLLNNNQLMGEIPESICNIDIFWISFPYFDIDNNQLCPPYPDCISEEDIGYQDTSECGEPDPQIGDECVTQDGWIGFYDCELCCWDEWIIENWLGDDWCDYLGGCGFEGPLFNCPELGYDCGDCSEDWDGTDPSGLCSDDCIFPGDINNDSILNILDIVSIITLILDGEYDECGDMNSDGTINVQDVVIFVNIILSTP